MAKGTKHEAVKLQGPELKMLKLAQQGDLSKSWRRQHQGPTCRREQVGNWPRSIGERDGAEPGRNGPGLVGPGRSTWPVLSPVHAPFDLRAPLYIASASVDRQSIHSSESRRHEGEAPGASRRPPQVLELSRRWPRPCPSRHGWPCVVKPWWSSRAHVLSRQLYILHPMVI
jgi:hypothetical protein